MTHRGRSQGQQCRQCLPALPSTDLTVLSAAGWEHLSARGKTDDLSVRQGLWGSLETRWEGAMFPELPAERGLPRRLPIDCPTIPSSLAEISQVAFAA